MDDVGERQGGEKPVPVAELGGRNSLLSVLREVGLGGHHQAGNAGVHEVFLMGQGVRGVRHAATAAPLPVRQDRLQSHIFVKLSLPL